MNLELKARGYDVMSVMNDDRTGDDANDDTEDHDGDDDDESDDNKAKNDKDKDKDNNDANNNDAIANTQGVGMSVDEADTVSNSVAVAAAFLGVYDTANR